MVFGPAGSSVSLGSTKAGAVVVVVVVEVLRFLPESKPEDEIALLGLTVVVKNWGSGVLPVIAAILAGSLGGGSGALGVSSTTESLVSSS